MTIVPVIKQSLVAGSTLLAAFSVGGAVTFPTLLLEHFRSNATSIQIDMDTKSWIGSIYGLAGIPAILMPMISHAIGRKLGYLITCSFLIMGWILAYTATNTTELLISEALHGLSTNSILPVSFLSMTEMLAPKYRFSLMQLFGVFHLLGMASCGILGRFLHYRTLSVIMFVPIAVASALAFLWIESPAWLACKGKFRKCEQCFIKLRGEDSSSKKELEELMIAERENLSRAEAKTTTIRRSWIQICSRDFYMPSLHTFLLLNMMYWSGCDVIYIYFIEMVAKSTNSEDAAFYASLVMYAIIFVGTAITNILILRFSHKRIMLRSACCVIVCLFCGCVITCLQTLNVIAKDSPLFMYCLLGFMASTSFGLMGMCFIISAEIMPVKHKNIGGALFVIFNCLLYSSSLKLSPYLFAYISLPGTLLLYLVNTISCALMVWKYVPDTRGRTLQEIEDFYKYGKFIGSRLCDNIAEAMNDDNK